MPDDRPERFAAAQIAGLKALGWREAELARELALLRGGFALRDWLMRLGEARHERG